MTDRNESLIKLDKVNVISLEHLGVAFQAIEDKIIVLMDAFVTGYECKKCHTSGRIESTVVQGATTECPDCKGKGVTLVIPEIAKSLPSTAVVVSMGPDTPAMRSQKRLAETKEYIKDMIERDVEEDSNEYIDAQEDLRTYTEELKNIPVQLGTRIVFNPHVGTLLPMKGNVQLKIMKVHEPLCIIFGNDVGSKNFIDYEATGY
jgi:hypothetical protein